MEIKCPVCGAPMENETCGYCGYIAKKENTQTGCANNISSQPTQQQVIQSQVVFNNLSTNSMGITPGISRKSKTAALLLCIFAGWLGVHKFYVGKAGMGILYLFTAGLFGIGWLVDIILIATGSFKDEFGLPLRQ